MSLDRILSTTRVLVLAAVAVVAASLVAAPALADADAASYVAAIESAHGGAVYGAQQAVAAEIVVEFGGQTILQGTMLFDPAVSKVRMELVGGSVIVFDGADAWVAGPEVPRARFHVLTWPYFFAAPFKLDDPGTHVESLGKVAWRGDALPAVELTFGDGVGDSPDDWYVVYRDPSTHRLSGLGYIVTYGTSVEQAEAEPHAVSYDAYTEIGDGVSVATDWSFWNWNREEGLFGDPIGRATISNPRFTTPADDAFAAPAGATKIAAP
ncbi:MAG: hypothetical protein AAGC60_12545 [Acidobacteriota bacterium]